MLRTLAVLAIVASVPSVFGRDLWYPGFHKKFAMFGGMDELPMIVADAVKQEYTEVKNPETSGFGDLHLYIPKSEKDKCTSTSVIGLYFDENGLIAGTRVSLPKDKVALHFDIEQQGLKTWEDTLSTSMFFVSEDKETRINAVNPLSSKIEVIRAKNVTVIGLDGVMDYIPANLDEVDVHPDWEKEACVIMMGLHYYYKMTPELTCDKAFHPYFPLYDQHTKQLIGMGLMLIGKCHCDLEEPALSAVKMIVPTAPQCLYDLVETVGVCTLHTYFVDHPRLISC